MKSISKSKSVTKYSLLTIVLHWMSALLVLIAFCLGWIRSTFEDNPWDHILLVLHQQIGLSIIAILVFRLFFRINTYPENQKFKSNKFLDLTATVAHIALYGFLAAMPIMGLLMTNAQGHAVDFLNLITLPNLIPIDPDLADTFQEWHETCAQLFLTLIGLHAAAGLFHHYVLKDDVLKNMLLRKRMDNDNQTID